MSADDYMEKVRAIHRRRVDFDPEFRFDVEHEKNVLALIQAFRDGKEPEPQAHWHADEERGLCTICDAACAITLAELEDDDG